MYIRPFIPWASETNYPAGANPWSGQPVRVLPVGDIFTPDTKPPAQYFNALFGAASDSGEDLAQAVYGLSPQNWDHAFIATAGPGGNDFGAAKCDYEGNWLLLTLHSGTHAWDVFIGKGLDGGAAAAWSQLGATFVESASVEFADISADPSNTANYWVATVINGGTTYRLHVYQFTPFSWTIHLNFGSTAGQNFYGASLCPFFPYIIVAMAAQDGASAFQSSNDNGATWHGFQTGTPPMPAGSEWLLKSNVGPNGGAGGMVLAIPGLAGLGAATGVWKTTDGVTWTKSATLTMLPAGTSIVGLAWAKDALGPCWIAMAQTSVATLTVLRSADGVTWTIQTADQPFARVADLAAFAPASPTTVGPVLVASLHDEATPYGSGQLFSIDGGLNWYGGPARLFANDVGSAGYTRARVASSGNGFFLFNSEWARFSALTGLPF